MQVCAEPLMASLKKERIHQILWINEHAAPVGGCEQYILRTVEALRELGISSVLLYNPNSLVDVEYLNRFSAAFPLVDIGSQIRQISFDVAYVHQYWDEKGLQQLSQCSQPVFRFYHDHRLFCLRKHKITTLRKQPCQKTAGWRCYPCLGFLQKSKEGLGMRSLKELRLEQWRDRGLDGVIVGSTYMKEHVIAHGYDEEKVHCLPPFIPSFPEKKLQREKGLLLCVGQLVYGKGFDTAIRALKELEEGVRLAVIGEGPQEESLKELARSEGVEERVSFLGSMGASELSSWYRKASCLLFPSRLPETFGLVGAEALWHGTPVVAADLGGVREWLHHEKNGLLIPPNDSQALAEAVKRVLGKEGIGRELGGEERFTQRVHVETLMALFERYRIPGKIQGATVYGDDEVERTIEEATHYAGERVLEKLSKDHVECLLLIGGYGKGEGGVEWREEAWRVHNNLDLLLVTRNLGKKERADIQGTLQEELSLLEEQLQIPVDLGIADRDEMLRNSQKLIWTEMRWGHRLILGSNEWMDQLKAQDSRQVAPFELTRLMSNRGTLLLINQCLEQTEHPKQHRRTVLKHIIKAIIGYGDALLYFLGDPHWSYRKKMRRIENHKDIPLWLKKEYVQAAEFRFCPDHKKFEKKDLYQWNRQLLERFGEIYLLCEQIRLGKEELSHERVLDDSLEKWVDWRGGRRPPRSFVGSSLRAKMGFVLQKPADRLVQFFPLIAFGWGSEKQRNQLTNYFRVEEGKLKRAFLREWGEVEDPHFLRFAEAHGLNLNENSVV